ncbi:MAG: CPBP family intramembrane metalloprotease [Acidobacteria bacterium]|nr:CPBP family intramembrane metalloprotease [Acidobacteriota bacterium]
MSDATPREVFWSWLDVVVFILLGVPSMLLASLLVHGLFLLLPYRPAGRAPELLGAQFAGYTFWFLSLYFLLKLKYDRPFWSSLGWRPGPSSPIVYFFSGPGLALGIGILGVLLRTPDIESPLKALLSDRTSLILVGVFAATLGPLCEELAFRGFFMPLLVRSVGVIPGILLSALPFGLLHGPEYAWSWRHILLVTVAGAAFGWLRHRTGSTAAATYLHAGYNVTFFVGFLAQGKQLVG